MNFIRIQLLTTAFVAFSILGAAAATPAEQNEKLLKATDPFEGLTETAIDGNSAKIAKAVKTAEEARPATRALLTAGAATRFDQLFDELTAAHAKRDFVTVALQSAELYKVLVTACDASALVVPMEVSLLDYAGFRIHALLKASAPDWSAIAAVTVEANGYWAKIRSRVANKKLQSGMDKAQAAMAASAAKHDAALSHSSAKANLDLVDDLEKFFAKE